MQATANGYWDSRQTSAASEADSDDNRDGFTGLAVHDAIYRAVDAT